MEKMLYNILILDDNKSMLDLIESVLKSDKWRLKTFNSANEAVKSLYSVEYDLIVTDLFMPEMDGFEFITEVRSINNDVPIIMITGMGGVDEAVKAIKKGADDFLIKPFSNEEFIIKIQKNIEYYSLKKELKFIKKSLHSEDPDALLVGKGPALKKIYRKIDQIASTNASVLITGESGTGKELLARMVHLKSKRAQKRFIPVDCSTLSEDIIESELFGYKKGAFTGADNNKKGILEEADGGTVFFDEIGNMTQRTQSKLLRFLQEKEIKPVGSNNIIKVDVRIVSATNANLRRNVEDGLFREDLFYRISAVELNIPPLRERMDDLPILIKHFIKKYCSEYNKKIDFITESALNILTAKEWKGNVRELENFIEHAVIIETERNISDNTVSSILPDRLFNSSNMDNESGDIVLLNEAVADFEKKHIVKILNQCANNRMKTSKMLGISRSVLYEKISKYEI